MYAPAAAVGGTHVPKRHDGVPRGARGDMGTSTSTAGESVDGFERPGIEKGERRGRGNAHIVDTDYALEPTRYYDLIRGAPRGRGRCRSDSVYGCRPLQSRVILMLR